MALTWNPSEPSTGSAYALCTAPASETFAKGATDGVNVANAAALDIYVEVDNAQTITAVGPLLCWIQNRITKTWCRAPNFDITIPSGVVGQQGGTDQGQSPGKGIPIVARAGRMAFVTGAGWTISGGTGLRIYHNVERAMQGV